MNEKTCLSSLYFIYYSVGQEPFHININNVSPFTKHIVIDDSIVYKQLTRNDMAGLYAFFPFHQTEYRHNQKKNDMAGKLIICCAL